MEAKEAEMHAADGRERRGEASSSDRSYAPGPGAAVLDCLKREEEEPNEAERRITASEATSWRVVEGGGGSSKAVEGRGRR